MMTPTRYGSAAATKFTAVLPASGSVKAEACGPCSVNFTTCTCADHLPGRRDAVGGHHDQSPAQTVHAAAARPPIGAPGPAAVPRDQPGHVGIGLVHRDAGQPLDAQVDRGPDRVPGDLAGSPDRVDPRRELGARRGQGGRRGRRRRAVRTKWRMPRGPRSCSPRSGRRHWAASVPPTAAPRAADPVRHGGRAGFVVGAADIFDGHTRGRDRAPHPGSRGWRLADARRASATLPSTSSIGPPNGHGRVILRRCSMSLARAHAQRQDVALLEPRDHPLGTSAVAGEPAVRHMDQHPCPQHLVPLLANRPVPQRSG